MKEQPKYLSATYKMIQIMLGFLFIILGFAKGVVPVGIFYNLQLFELKIFQKNQKRKRKESE